MPVRNIVGNTNDKHHSECNRILDDYTIKHANADTDQHKHSFDIPNKHPDPDSNWHQHADANSDQHRHAVPIRDPDADAVRDGDAKLDQQPDRDADFEPDQHKLHFAIPNTDAIGVANADPDTLGRDHLRVDLHVQQCWRRQSVQPGYCEWPRRCVFFDPHGNNLYSTEHLL